MFRFNNPDAFLVLLLTLAAYATVRAVESGRTRWIVLAGALVGFGFLAKMLQAFLVVPAFGARVPAGRARLGRRRIGQLAVGAAALVAAAGWWVLAVKLTPAADRPYIGGSQNNSLWNLIFGYNGFGRLTGNETGSVGGAGAPAAARGARQGDPIVRCGHGRQISWLLPAALILLVPGSPCAARRPDRPHPGRSCALGRMAPGNRRGVQLRSRHHPSVLHGGAGAGGRRHCRNRRLHAVGPSTRSGQPDRARLGGRGYGRVGVGADGSQPDLVSRSTGSRS